MDGYSRDLLGGIGGGGDGPLGGEQEWRSEMELEEVELTLGLSLGGRFGLERGGGERLARSSSVASIVATEEVALAPPALARTSSLPTIADVEEQTKHMIGDAVGVAFSARPPVPRSAGHGNGIVEVASENLLGSGSSGNVVEVDTVAKLRVSGSPSSGSSDGEANRLKVNAADTLIRTSSLPAFPAGMEDQLRKRKEAQTLKRLEVKRKRIERRNSSTASNVATGQMLVEMNAVAENIEASDDISARNKQIGGNMNHVNDKHRTSGLPPPYQAAFTSRGNNSSAMPKWQNSSVKGTPSSKNQSLSSAIPPLAEGTNGALLAEGTSSTATATASSSAIAVRAVTATATVSSSAIAVGAVTATATASSSAFAAIATASSSALAATSTASSSALAVRAPALGPSGDQQLTLGKRSARAKSMGDVEKMMMQEMPCVCTKGLPNGRRIEGFLYKYRKGEEVRIVCVCHGSFLTPVEFVKHAGGGDVANPLRHIVVNPTPASF